jgi:hypothetical protein
VRTTAARVEPSRTGPTPRPTVTRSGSGGAAISILPVALVSPPAVSACVSVTVYVPGREEVAVVLAPLVPRPSPKSQRGSPASGAPHGVTDSASGIGRPVWPRRGYGLAPLRVRGLACVSLHADVCILGLPRTRARPSTCGTARRVAGRSSASNLGKNGRQPIAVYVEFANDVPLLLEKAGVIQSRERYRHIEVGLMFRRMALDRSAGLSPPLRNLRLHLSRRGRFLKEPLANSI